MEYARAERYGKLYQLHDAELCMVLDTVTGQPERAFPSNSSIGTLEQALSFLKSYPSDRRVIVRLSCIQASVVGG